MEDIRNEEGKVVLPESKYDPLDPVNGAVYVKDEEYEALKSPAPQAPQGDNPPQTEEPKAPDTSAAVDYDAIVKEKTGGKYEKWEDLARVIEAPAPQLPELDDTAKQIIESLHQGKYDEVATFLTQQQVLGSLDKMSDDDVIKLRIQIENQDFSEEDVADEYDQRYGVGVDKDDVSEDEYAKLERRAMRKQKSDAKEARQILSAMKKDLKLPSFAPQPQSNPEVDQFVNEVNSLGEEFAKGVDSSLSNFSKLDLSISDQDVQFAHEFTVDEAEKAELGIAAKDFWSHIKSRYYKDGKYDTQQYLKDLYIQKHFGKILKSAVTRAINLGKIDVAKGVANITDKNAVAPSTNFADDARRAGMENFAYS